ncbi:MAG: LytTR family DNA-binding domain-containing protein [Bacteroidota bacterium]
MTHRCLIVDDEELARELIASHLSQLPQFELAASCASAIEAHSVLQTTHIDLLFLDIEMPVLKGTDFLSSLLHPPKVIFTTAYRDYAINGFELNAVDYLLKPIIFERFFKATEKYLLSHSAPTRLAPNDKLRASPALPTANRKDHIFIRKDRKQVRLQLDQIDYVESQKDYVVIVTPTVIHRIKSPLTAFLNQLDGRFLRIHRSYLVNTEKVTAFSKQDVEIGTKELPIGEYYREEVARVLGFGA